MITARYERGDIARCVAAGDCVAGETDLFITARLIGAGIGVDDIPDRAIELLPDRGQRIFSA